MKSLSTLFPLWCFLTILVPIFLCKLELKSSYFCHLTVMVISVELKQHTYFNHKIKKCQLFNNFFEIKKEIWVLTLFFLGKQFFYLSLYKSSKNHIMQDIYPFPSRFWQIIRSSKKSSPPWKSKTWSRDIFHFLDQEAIFQEDVLFITKKPLLLWFHQAKEFSSALAVEKEGMPSPLCKRLKNLISEMPSRNSQRFNTLTSRNIVLITKS